MNFSIAQNIVARDSGINCDWTARIHAHNHWSNKCNSFNALLSIEGVLHDSRRNRLDGSTFYACVCATLAQPHTILSLKKRPTTRSCKARALPSQTRRRYQECLVVLPNRLLLLLCLLVCTDQLESYGPPSNLGSRRQQGARRVAPAFHGCRQVGCELLPSVPAMRSGDVGHQCTVRVIQCAGSDVVLRKHNNNTNFKQKVAR